MFPLMDSNESEQVAEDVKSFYKLLVALFKGLNGHLYLDKGDCNKLTEIIKGMEASLKMRCMTYARFLEQLRNPLRLTSLSLIATVILLDWRGVDLRSNPCHSPKKRFAARIATALQCRYILYIVSLGMGLVL